MPLIPIYTKEQLQSWIDAVELLKPDLYDKKIFEELIQFKVKTQEEALQNINRKEPSSYPCGCLGGPEGCSMCYCSLTHKSYAYRFHLYLHYFYPETIND